MRTAKRITTACLTAIMIFQALAPSTEVFAQELDAVMEASVSAARAAGIPIFERAQAWGHLMRSYKNAICVARC